MQVVRLIILFVIPLLLTDCSSSGNFKSKPIIILEPTSTDTKWLFGQEFARQTIDEVEINIAFYRVINKQYVFDVQIKNMTDNPVIISPEKSYYYTLKETKTTSSKKIYANNPESEINQIDYLISEENKSYGDAVAADALFSLLDFAVSIATIGDDKTDEEIQYEYEIDEIKEENRIIRDENHEAKLTDLTQMRDNWEISTLRKTTLESNSYIQGRIYFPSSNDSNLIKISFNVENRFFNFLFKISYRYLA